MGAEWEAVTAGEGAWWPGPLSLSVFTVLDVDDVAGLKREKKKRGRLNLVEICQSIFTK